MRHRDSRPQHTGHGRTGPQAVPRGAATWTGDARDPALHCEACDDDESGQLFRPAKRKFRSLTEKESGRRSARREGDKAGSERQPRGRRAGRTERLPSDPAAPGARTGPWLHSQHQA